MADELQIKAVTTSNSTVGPSTGSAGTTANTGGSTNQTGIVTGEPMDMAAPQVSAAAAGNVIDLRGLDQKAGQNSGTAQSATGKSVSTTTQNTTAPQTTAATQTATAAQTTDESYTSALGQVYVLPKNVSEKFPDLMKLIKETESMNDEEREYWFQILPIMTEEQIKKFRDILVNEKEQLAKLDKDYESELTKLNEKHMIEWKAFESKEKRKALNQAEQKSNEEELAQEEDLLKRLSTV